VTAAHAHDDNTSVPSRECTLQGADTGGRGQGQGARGVCGAAPEPRKPTVAAAADHADGLSAVCCPQGALAGRHLDIVPMWDSCAVAGQLTAAAPRVERHCQYLLVVEAV
jgi:hypothetical protein